MQVTIQPEAAMAEPGKFQNHDHRLYLEDLEVGRRFTSATHAIDEAQIKPYLELSRVVRDGVF